MPTRFKGPKSRVRALDAFIKLMRASDSVANSLHEGLAREGMTQGQLAVLEALLHIGPMCQRDLAAKLLRSGANTTAVLDALEKRGFVLRTRQVDDRRRFEVSLTTAGRRTIERVFPAHAGRIEAAFGALTAAEIEDLGRLCKKVGLGVSRRTETKKPNEA